MRRGAQSLSSTGCTSADAGSLSFVEVLVDESSWEAEGLTENYEFIC